MRFSVFVLGLFAVGCGAEEQAVESTGAMLSVDYFGDTDVVGFRFEIERVACDAYDTFEPETIVANVDLVDGIFPGMISLVEQTLDPSSRHLASDFFVTLPPGCYDVQAIPLSDYDSDELWKASNDCSVADAAGVEVEAGQTTEITLLSQCEGDPNGAVDVLVVLNHPPAFDLTIDEKFNYECEPVRACATVTDPDDDPIEVTWAWSPSGFLIDADEPEVVGFEDGHRVWEACATITTQYTMSYDITVSVYDLAANGERFEDLVTPETSSASLVFPIHTNWIEEPLCWLDGDLVPADGVDIERTAGCSWTSAETFYCSGAYDHMTDPAVVEHICDGTDLIEELLYPEC